MEKLNPQQVEILYRHLVWNGTDEALFEELLDHLACEVEHYMWIGLPFETALEKVQLEANAKAVKHLRKTYQNGKQEYFSLQLHLLEDMAYLGTANVGTLQLRTKEDEVIVQTYKDRSGDVDSMSTSMVIPLKDVEADDLNKLNAQFNGLKGMLK
ncbi:MAG: hypothetical protein EOP49_49190 [Sphingobacteriales bacterium]|nr:MAG: hypothetical protein EOP49_49190 [Sphingobacteriales bacterium]